MGAHAACRKTPYLKEIASYIDNLLHVFLNRHLVCATSAPAAKVPTDKDTDQ
jgi:hypothetical protein